MTNRKNLFTLMLALACSAVIVWLGMGCGEEIDPDYQCGTESLRQANRTNEVFHKYNSLFNRYPSPNVIRGFLRDEKIGGRTETWGIVILVTKKANQEALLSEHRVPDFLEGVPIQIIPKEIANMADDFQGGGIDERDPHVNLVFEVSNKNRNLFYRNPSFKGVGLPYVDAGNDPGNRIWGIRLYVAENVQQSSLSPTVRIPDCLEDVPVKFIVRPD